MRTATFTTHDLDPAVAVRTLVRLGFVFDAPVSETRTVLDTFDGRLHAEGLRLEARGANHLRELVLESNGGVARLAVDAVPRRPSELPAGPFRDRLARLVDVRVLLPVLQLTTTARAARWQDGMGKTVALASLHQDVAIEGRAGPERSGWLLELRELTGYRSFARDAGGALEKAGLRRTKGDLVTATAAAAGVDLRGVVSSATVPVDADGPTLDGFCAVLANLAVTMELNWDGAADAVDPEFLHDLRVALRRTRSIVAQSTKVLPVAMREHGRDRCAWLGAITGPPRDHDVQLLDWDRSLAGLGADTIAALAPVRVVLQQRCDVAHATLADALRSPEAVAFLATWRRWLADPASAGDPGPRADTPLARFVTRRIARAQDRLLEHGRAVDDATPPALIHELRKDGKKLRYLLECFAGVLADGPRKAFVSRLKALQENLGAFQDADVHIAELRDISAELYRNETPRATLVAVLRMLERLDADRAAARAEFGERFRVYDTAETSDAFEAMLGRSRH